jgi:Xaa-Pro dipeptidase
MSLSALFREHVAERQRKAAEALRGTEFDALVFSSGSPHTYFADDWDAPFHPLAHFAHWCPLAGPHHLLLVVPGARPRLVRFAPEDYWFEPQELGEPFWTSEFEIVEVGTREDAWKALGPVESVAYLGDEVERALEAGFVPNPEKVVSRLDWDRAYKTDYEVRCLEEASALAAKGHVAARNAFEAGASELAIYYAFLEAMERTEHELPYSGIVAVDEKAAYLHYTSKRRVENGNVLLIDAGAQSRSYAADVTRTHVARKCDERFIALRDGVAALQQELCRAVRPGIPFGDLHLDAHRRIAALLVESDLLSADAEEAVSSGWTRPFFPHGLGHHLGLQVHDVGGHLKDRDGAKNLPSLEHPYLRNTRTIEPRHVFTMEPGLYFIEMLLRELRQGEAASRFNWKLIDELSPLGGIRIEDDLLVTDHGHRNLTREHL